MKKTLLAIALLASPAFAGDRWSAIDTRPHSAIDTRPHSAIETRRHWDQPARGLTLQQETEHALDRGNGRIVDQPTYELAQIERYRVCGMHRAFDLAQAEWDRQFRIDRAKTQAANEQRRTVIVERESQRLAGERERWMKQMAKPRHAEAAIVDAQGKKR